MDEQRQYRQKIRICIRAINNYANLTVLRRIKNDDFDFPPLNTIGQRIKLERLKKGIYIKTLAKQSGMTPESISYFEAGREPDIHSLAPLAKTLEVTVQYLGGFESMPETTFIERLDKARCYHAHNWDDVAKAVGVNRRTVWGWIHMGRTPANMAAVEKYMKTTSEPKITSK